ncbi:hypothetical protein RB195_007514 [Necator americanus]|uniref:Helix-turn-helix domain-containing protein n=1 Tax=Necator americanus TaxID=51031 RepID=A0ABR1C0B8_NECAM
MFAQSPAVILSFGMFINTTSSCSCARKRVRCIAAVKESETKGMHKGILPPRGISLCCSYIKLTREQSKDGWLPYLNAQIKLHNGIASVKWYRKESSKNILINAKSAHPNGMKKAIIRNMVKTATAMCTGDREREESLKLATNIASSNCYSRLKSNTQSRTTNNTVRIPREGRIPLCIPFVSDSLTAAIHRTFLRAQLQDDVVLVNIPNDSIKRQLVRNRFYDRQCVSECCVVCPFGKAGDCANIGVRQTAPDTYRRRDGALAPDSYNMGCDGSTGVGLVRRLQLPIESGATGPGRMKWCAITSCA